MILVSPDGTVRLLRGEELLDFVSRWQIFQGNPDHAAYATWLLEDLPDEMWPHNVINALPGDPATRTVTAGMAPLTVTKVDDHWGITVFNYAQFGVVPWEPAKTEEWTVVGLDVWGNETDGWEINDLRRLGKIELRDDTSFVDLVQILKEDYIEDETNARVDYVDEYTVDVVNNANDRPLLRLEIADRDRSKYELPPLRGELFHVRYTLRSQPDPEVHICDRKVYSTLSAASDRARALWHLRSSLFSEPLGTVVAAPWRPDAVEADREAARQARIEASQRRASGYRAVEDEPAAVIPGAPWYVAWDSGVDTGVFTDAYANEEDAIAAGEEWARQMNFMARTEGDDSEPYSFEVIQRPRDAAPAPAPTTCPQCGQPRRMRYPGGDPENGPARFMCVNECVSPAEEAAMAAAEDEEHAEAVERAYQSGQWHIVFVVNVDDDANETIEIPYDDIFNSRAQAVDAALRLVQRTPTFHGYPVYDVRVAPGLSIEGTPSETTGTPTRQVWYVAWMGQGTRGIIPTEYATSDAAVNAVHRHERAELAIMRPENRRTFFVVLEPRAVTRWAVIDDHSNHVGNVDIHADTSERDFLESLISEGFLPADGRDIRFRNDPHGVIHVFEQGGPEILVLRPIRRRETN